MSVLQIREASYDEWPWTLRPHGGHEPSTDDALHPRGLHQSRLLCCLLPSLPIQVSYIHAYSIGWISDVQRKGVALKSLCDTSYLGVYFAEGDNPAILAQLISFICGWGWDRGIPTHPSPLPKRSLVLQSAQLLIIVVYTIICRMSPSYQLLHSLLAV